jgi:hypothetical protein
MFFHLTIYLLCLGYLYHIPGHIRRAGKGVGVQRIATYPFTSPVIDLGLESCLLHALTETGNHQFCRFGSESGSVGSVCGSGSFYHQAKIVRKILIPTVL